MSEYSFPVPEEPMPAKDWPSVTLGIGSGVLDEGGFPYNLINFNNATNTAELTAANLGDNVRRSNAIIDGFYHKIDANLVLDLPAVTSTTTYYVALQFDPIRGTEHGMPVKAVVVTKLDYTGGKNYLTLWTVRREPNQLLTEATVRMLRPRVAPTMVFASQSDMPQANKTLWGTLAVIHGGRSSNRTKIFMAMTGDDGESTTGWFWKQIYDQADPGAFTWSPFADTGTYTNPGSGHTRAIGRRGRERRLRGRVSLVSGNQFGPGVSYNVLSGAIPAEDAPAATERFICGVSGSISAGPRMAVVEVNSAGDVTATVSASATFIDLANCWWETKA